MMDENYSPEKLFIEDQEDRRKLAVNEVGWDYVNPRDELRLKKAKELIENGLTQFTGLELWYLSFIFQHSDFTDDYLVGNRIAKESLKKGFKKAIWIICATYDRYLVTTTNKQAYKTQYRTINNEKVYAPQDPKYTNTYLLSIEMPTHDEFEKSLQN